MVTAAISRTKTDTPMRAGICTRRPFTGSCFALPPPPAERCCTMASDWRRRTASSACPNSSDCRAASSCARALAVWPGSRPGPIRSSAQRGHGEEKWSSCCCSSPSVPQDSHCMLHAATGSGAVAWLLPVHLGTVLTFFLLTPIRRWPTHSTGWWHWLGTKSAIHDVRPAMRHHRKRPTERSPCTWMPREDLEAGALTRAVLGGGMSLPEFQTGRLHRHVEFLKFPIVQIRRNPREFAQTKLTSSDFHAICALNNPQPGVPWAPNRRGARGRWPRFPLPFLTAIREATRRA